MSGGGGHIRRKAFVNAKVSFQEFFFLRVKCSCDYCFHDNLHSVGTWHLNREPVPLCFIINLRF